jgi:hypothetical protein
MKKIKYNEIYYVIYFIRTLFITLGDASIDLSPRPANQSNNRVNQPTDRPRTGHQTRVLPAHPTHRPRTPNPPTCADVPALTP